MSGLHQRGATRLPAMLLLLAAAALAAWIVFGGEEESEAPTMRGGFQVPVTVVTVAPGEVAETVELVGDVASQRIAEIGFERAGRVTDVLVDLGDTVRHGDVLARLNNAVLQEQLAVAQAAAEASAAEADYADREAERLGKLVDLVEETQRDKAASDAEARRHRAEERAADVRRLSEVLALGVLKAPFDAIVTERYVTEGSYVAVGERAFDLVDMTRRQVELEVPAPVAAVLREGAEVFITLDEQPDFRLATRLDVLVPAADFKSRSFTGIVRLYEPTELDPERRLLPGLFVRAEAVLKRVSSDTVVPTDAIRRDARGDYVVAVDDAEDQGDPPLARFVPVTVLARGADFSAVRPLEAGALAPGVPICVTGVDNVFPGAALRTVDHDGETPPAPAPGEP